jgi:hypothetical protein
MARKHRPKTKKAPEDHLSSDTAEPLGVLYAHIFLNFMSATIKAKSVEGKIAPRLQGLAKEQIERVADAAGKYYVAHLNLSKTMTDDEMEDLQSESIEYALNQL